MRENAVNLVGAGLAGSLLALLLARRGLHVRVFERRPDPRQAAAERGRSINLALAARGIRALERAGVMPAIQPLLIEMRGRMVHDLDGRQSLVSYGQRAHEVIHSVSRGALNLALLEAADTFPNVELRFDQACRGLDLEAGTLLLRDTVSGEDYGLPLQPTIASDGAGSAVREALAAAGRLRAAESLLDHDYKELTIAPSADGGFALERHALHVWPRGGFMLIALPNPDATFTVTLFLAREGAASFAALREPADVRAFFGREFADALPLLGEVSAQFAANPQGRLGTVRCDRWHDGGRVLLLGDAAHAIVPFHGQGMNCAFEDCIELAELLHGRDDWSAVFAEFQRRRQPNAEAIAQMALENYVEMRDTVRDPAFLRQKSIALQLERRHPRRFIPRYSMVSFHPEIPYAEALRRGAVQARILQELDSGGGMTPEPAFDLARADVLVNRELTEIA
jgi:kynurenine 3-monooxygenase